MEGVLYETKNLVWKNIPFGPAIETSARLFDGNSWMHNPFSKNMPKAQGLPK